MPTMNLRMSPYLEMKSLQCKWLKLKMRSKLDLDGPQIQWLVSLEEGERTHRGKKAKYRQMQRLE